jgi:hypothetical protein
MESFVRKESFESIEKDVEDLKERMMRSEKDIEAIKEILSKLGNSNSGNGNQSNSGASSSELILLRNRIEYLENTLSQLKKTF